MSSLPCTRSPVANTEPLLSTVTNFPEFWLSRASLNWIACLFFTGLLRTQSLQKSRAARLIVADLKQTIVFSFFLKIEAICFGAFSVVGMNESFGEILSYNGILKEGSLRWKV